jgi:hypothetical protein
MNGPDVEGVLAEAIEDALSEEYGTFLDGGTPSGVAHLITAHVAAVLREQIAAAQAEAVRGIRFRVETACDGYAHLADEDVPGDVTDTAAYQEGAHDAAEAIRAELAAQVAPSRVPGEES